MPTSDATQASPSESVSASQSAGAATGHATGRGLSLVSTLVALALVSIALLGVVAFLPKVLQMSQVARENQRATTAIRSELDARRAMPFPTTASPSFLDGPFTFVVPGLTPPSPGAEHGTVRFLSEAEAQIEFGRALDLDDDFVTGEEEAPHPGFTVYPVELTVRWLSHGDPRTVSTITFVYNHRQ
ncbi:MAG: type IV pilus modification PilV family protein [Planctomycetota bacterium]